MKTHTKLDKQSVAKRLRGALEGRGLTDEVIDLIVSKSLVSKAQAGPGRIPRPVTEKMKALFAKGGRGSQVVVTWTKSGGFRVYSREGFEAQVETGRKVGSLPKKGHGPACGPVGQPKH